MINPFFKNTGPHDINYLLESINLKNQKFSNEKITNIKDLSSSQTGEISFFHTKKYNNLAKITKASYCLTTENLKSIWMLFALGSLLFTGIILFHIVTGVIAGATPYVNVVLTALFTLAFYVYSRA